MVFSSLLHYIGKLGFPSMKCAFDKEILGLIEEMCWNFQLHILDIGIMLVITLELPIRAYIEHQFS